MESLKELLISVQHCNACGLMDENASIGVPFVPILPKPNAKFIFIGRDPSPRTAKIVGLREGKSVFIKEIFDIADKANVSEEYVYVTDLCKCHWRTSVGKPLSNTEHRSPKLDLVKANICMKQWLVREIELLNPQLIVAFGEELYQLLRPLIVNPTPPPEQLSAKADKSEPDAESWFVHNGPLVIKIGVKEWRLAILRHPGNSRRLSKSSNMDRRLEFHQKATAQVITLLKEAYQASGIQSVA